MAFTGKAVLLAALCVLAAIRVSEASAGAFADKQQLLAFKKAVNSSSSLHDWTNASGNRPCGNGTDNNATAWWTGVKCDNTTNFMNRRVIGLDLSSGKCNGVWVGVNGTLVNATYVNGTACGLNGTLSALNIPLMLQYLNLADNAFHGSIPRFNVLEGRFLTYVKLSRNAFTGNVAPRSLPANIKTFAAASNKLSGAIATLGWPQSLLELDLSFNGLSGKAPQFFSRLQKFNIAGNKMTGAFPTTFPKNLVTLNIAHNGINGSFSNITYLTKLSVLDVSGNELNATSVRQLLPQNVTELYLQDNKAINGTLCGLLNLIKLNITNTAINQSLTVDDAKLPCPVAGNTTANATTSG